MSNLGNILLIKQEWPNFIATSRGSNFKRATKATTTFILPGTLTLKATKEQTMKLTSANFKTKVSSKNIKMRKRK